MSELLSQEQIASLVEAARSGALPDDGSKPAHRRGRRIRTIDFTRPTKFTTEQERRIRRALDTFCRASSARLSAELRSSLDLEVINSQQLTWADAHRNLPRHAICALVEISPGGGRLLLAAEQPLVLASIERLLGGSEESAPRSRRMSDVDWVLARHLFGTLVSQLTPVWSDLAGQTLELDSVDSQMELSQLAPVSEPTLELTMESRLGPLSTTVMLLIPYMSIAAVAEHISGRDEGMFDRDPAAPAAVEAALRGVEVTVRAEVARVPMTVAEVLALRPGDVVRLNAPVERGITVCTDETPIYRARPGRWRVRRAVQVTGPAGAGA